MFQFGLLLNLHGSERYKVLLFWRIWKIGSGFMEMRRRVTRLIPDILKEMLFIEVDMVRRAVLQWLPADAFEKYMQNVG